MKKYFGPPERANLRDFGPWGEETFLIFTFFFFNRNGAGKCLTNLLTHPACHIPGLEQRKLVVNFWGDFFTSRVVKRQELA